MIVDVVLLRGILIDVCLAAERKQWWVPPGPTDSVARRACDLFAGLGLLYAKPAALYPVVSEYWVATNLWAAWRAGRVEAALALAMDKIWEAGIGGDGLLSGLDADGAEGARQADRRLRDLSFPHAAPALAVHDPEEARLTPVPGD